MCQVMCSFERVNGAGQPGLRGKEVWGYVGVPIFTKTFYEKVLMRRSVIEKLVGLK